MSAAVAMAPEATRDEAAPLLSARALTKHFPIGRSLLPSRRGTVRAVEAVDLDIAPGEVVGVVGESGSGKSTLGRLVLRLLEATSGTVSFEDQDLGALDANALRRFRRNFQMIFQDPISSLNARMTVGGILTEPLRLHFGLDGRAAEAAAVRLLEQVGLSARHMKRYPRSFSGGQGQRIAIARALASSPKFIVADEPVSALDVSVQADVVNLMRSLQQELRLALMFISHDLSVVEVIADRVVVLYLGRVMESAPTEALYRRPAHPYTAALLQAVPGAVSPENRVILKGEIPSPAAPPSGCVFRTRCPFAIADCARTVPPLREVAPDQFKACIRDDIAL
ncbi:MULTISPECIES: oligopeptide/dipeptide ABC transporter ATP-binding protein [unclassified Roseitalea]|uniref:ABC transporter ATP-binding protein n=1 Tax=unclassified Roseitalea TaxID=2639107 RepID=UPI00273FDCFE|nr:MULTISPECIES: oligopeptide/dipeptide ABC transporter ATP-binding protein [unclassified Roseitalea]